MLEQLIRDRMSSKSDVVDIITFAEAPWGLNLTLFPAQKFILKLMHGLDLDDKVKGIEIFKGEFKQTLDRKLTELDYFYYLKDEGRLSPSYEIGEERRETVLAIGRRGSKTRLSSVIVVYNIYRLLSMYDPHGHYDIPLADKIGFAALATSKDQARELFTPVRAGVLATHYIDQELVVGSSETELKIISKKDRDEYGAEALPSIWAAAYPCTGRGGRGAANMVVVFDEFAHFMLNGAASDVEVYKGVTPSVASFGEEGKIISISSPLSKSGKFYELFTQGMEDNPDILSIQAPCWEINTRLTPKTLKAEWRKDPDSYMNEFGAKWSGHIVDYIRDPDVFKRNVNPDRTASIRGERRKVYFMGVDLGAVNDSTAIAVAHAEGPMVIVDLIEEMEPPRIIAAREGQVLAPEEEELQFEDVATRCDELCKAFNVQKGVYDSWNGYGFGQFLAKFGLRNTFEMVTYTRPLNSQIYKLLKRLLYENRIEFYPHPKFEHQFLRLQETKLSKYEIKVEAPSGERNHDDLPDGVVRAVHLVCDQMGADKVPLMAATVDGIVVADPNSPLYQEEKPLKSLRQYHLRRKRAGGVNPRYERLAMVRGNRGRRR